MAPRVPSRSCTAISALAAHPPQKTTMLTSLQWVPRSDLAREVSLAYPLAGGTDSLHFHSTLKLKDKGESN